MRAFIAAIPSKSSRSVLIQQQLQLNLRARDVRLTKPENTHMTLCFLGEQQHKDLQRLTHELFSTLKAQPSFDLRGEKISGFPSPRSRVIALHVTLNPHLEALHNSICHILLNLQMSYDKKPFHPHITLGRLKHKTLIEASTCPFKDTVTHITLLTSQLSDQGPTYRTFAEIPLST